MADLVEYAEHQLAALLGQHALLPVGHEGVDEARGRHAAQKAVALDEQHAARAAAPGLHRRRHARQPAAAHHDVVFSHSPVKPPFFIICAPPGRAFIHYQYTIFCAIINRTFFLNRATINLNFFDMRGQKVYHIDCTNTQ